MHQTLVEIKIPSTYFNNHYYFILSLCISTADRELNIPRPWLFGILVAVTMTVQNAFHLEMHQNKIFYFLKIIFDISTSKRSENIKKKIILSKKKSKFLRPNTATADLHVIHKRMCINILFEK
jgi:hypothetical protein